ncbi:hypothetical protein [Leptospira perdikensis]|uniref:Uncharacterized protein n=1 Tax=Leptospira perdikensis TaxID=2484948 RepID=A0A4R9JGB8_9LEPT|nr:hypothetical protein [Leptospira perdikensis]TGL37647.1 hypothetical protein EHQ49_15625 [Leptospira perdikensis]
MKLILLFIVNLLFILNCQTEKEKCLEDDPIANQCSKSMLSVLVVDESCLRSNGCEDTTRRQNIFLVSCLTLEKQKKKCDKPFYEK